MEITLFSKVGFPRNFSTGRTYQGVNVFLLGSLRFTSPYFLTFIQTKELGGNVRKGERGSLVVKYGSYNKQEDSAAAPEDERAESRRFFEGLHLFHASQIEGIEFPHPENLPELSVTEKTARAREIIAAMPNPPAIHEGNAVPCYRPKTDSVHMPEGGFFDSEEDYYSTLFHELAHSTGHTSCLARKSLLENKGIEAGEGRQKLDHPRRLAAQKAANYIFKCCHPTSRHAIQVSAWSCHPIRLFEASQACSVFQWMSGVCLKFLLGSLDFSYSKEEKSP